MVRKGKRKKKKGGKRSKYGRNIGAIKMEREGAEEEWKGKEKREEEGNEKEAKEVRGREERGSLRAF